MARLEIPVRAFIEDFCSRAFPTRDFSRGSAVSDLVVKPFAALMQPVRHELDLIKISQSVKNYLYMPTDAMDALAANWGYFRQSGSQAYGNVTLYFDTASDYAFNYLEFVSDDGVSFLLTSPVTISAAALLRNKQSDGTYAADVSVRSVGKGNRYQLASGSINTVRNRPAGIVRVTNLVDFSVTAPDESNFDIVNGMFRNLGLQNLVSRQSIRGPLYQQFPGVLDIYVTGAGHPKMIRDLVVLSEDTQEQVHVGSAVDVWVNTSNLQTKTCDISYLPASGKLRLVSQEQVDAGTAAFLFSSAAVSFLGLFVPDTNQTAIDESIGVIFSERGIAREAFVSHGTAEGSTLLASAAKTSGTGLILPSKYRASSSVILDPTGASFSAATVAVGDAVRVGDHVFPVSAVSGRALRVGPAVNSVAVTTEITADADEQQHLLSVLNSGGTALGDSAVISTGAAAGWYRVIGTPASDQLDVGSFLSNGTVSYVDTVGSVKRWLYSGAVPAELPVLPAAFADVAGISSSRYPIIAITRAEGQIILSLDSAITLPTSISLVLGLRGAVTAGTSITVYSSVAGAEIPESSALASAKGHTLISDETILDLAAGTSELTGIGFIEADVRAGDVVVWDLADGSLSSELLAASGGDGTVYTSIVSSVSRAGVSFTPALPIDIPSGTSWAIMRNGPRMTTFGTISHSDFGLYSTSQSAHTGSNISLAGWARGLGDGAGMALIGGDSISATVASVSDPFVTLSDASQVAAGDTLSQGGNYWRVVEKNVNVLHVIPSPDFTSASTTFPTAGSCTVARVRVRVVAATQLSTTTTLFFAAPRLSRTITFSGTSYVSPSPTDINRPVTQVVGGTTYSGTLASYDVTTRSWTVIPTDIITDVFSAWSATGEEVTIVGSLASGRALSVSAPGTVGYIAPTGADVGKKVRQGPYIGTLAGYAANYEWYVHPDTPTDLFDRTDIPTYIDQNDDVVQNSTEPYGYLRAPADAPEFGSAVSGVVSFALDAPTPFTDSTAIGVYSRFGRSGCFGSDGKLTVAPVSSINTATFDSLTIGSSDVIIPVGAALGSYSVQTVDSSSAFVTLDANAPSVVSIPYGHAETTLTGAAISAGTSAGTPITFPGTTIGLFGHAGRVLRVAVSSTIYYLPILSPGATNDSVSLSVAFPVAISPSTQVSVAVVDAYITPFFVIDTTKTVQYYITSAPNISSTTAIEGTGVMAADGTLSDATLPMASALYGSDGLWLYIDGGANASTDPYAITQVYDTAVKITPPAGLVAESFVPYHVTYKPVTTYTAHIGRVAGSLVTLQEPLPAGLIPAAHRAVLVPIAGSQVPVFAPIASASGYSLTLQSSTALTAGTAVYVYITRMDQTMTSAAMGTAVYTYNYYANSYMSLPVARMLSVEMLDTESLTPLKSVAFNITPVVSGYRYSAAEVNDLVILDSTAVNHPLRLTYITDPTIGQISAYLESPDTHVQGMSTIAKRMETIVVNISVTVRSEKTATELQDILSQYIQAVASTAPVSKDSIIKYLYEQQAVSMVDVASFTLTATYLQDDGATITYTDSASIFGADTAAYLAGTIVVLKVN